MVDQNLHGVEQRMLAAHRSNHLFPPITGIEISGVALHNGVAQFSRAAHRRILCEVALNRGDTGVLDVLGRGKVWLTRSEIHHVNALLAQLVGFSHDRHGGGGLDPVDTLGEF